MIKNFDLEYQNQQVYLALQKEEKD
jgi:hypothetical protein